MPPRLGCLVLLVLAGPAVADEAPLFQGRTARDWMPVLPQAALALLRHGRKADAVTPVLNDLLRALTPAIRLETAMLIQQLGPAAKSTAPALAEALRDEHLEILLPAEGVVLEPGMAGSRPR